MKKMMKKMTALLVTMMMMVAVLAPAQVYAEESYTIGVNIGYPDQEFFQMVEAGIKDSFDALGWEYFVTYGAEEKITENGATLIAQGVDAIVDFGCHTDIGAALVMMADEAGIPVICVDVAYEGGYFVGANNVQAGEKLGEAMTNWINENWEGQLDSIYVSYSERDSEAVKNRTFKAVEKLQEAFGTADEDVFWYDAGAAMQEGVRQTFTDYLSANEDQKHIATVNVTEVFAQSTIAAAETMGRGSDVCHGTHSESSWTYDHFDTTDAETDTYVGCVAYSPDGYGAYIAEMLQTLFAGGELGAETLMEHEVITRENYKEYQENYIAFKEKIESSK